MAFSFAFLIACPLRNAAAAGESPPPKAAGKLAFDCIPRAKFQLGGLPGERVQGERRALVDRRAAEQPRACSTCSPSGIPARRRT